MRRKSRRDKDAFYTDLNDPIDIIWLLAVRAKVIDLGYAPEEAAFSPSRSHCRGTSERTRAS